MSFSVQIRAVPGVPDIEPGCDLPGAIGDCLAAAGGLSGGDIVCVAHKIVSKAEGNVIRLSDVTASPKAKEMAEELGKDPRKVEVVLGQSRRVVKSWRRPDQNEGTMICEHRLGFISANAAVDESNAEAGTLITLPDDPDASARKLGIRLETRFGCDLGVVITDTFGRPWRTGQVNVAIGLYKVPAKTSDVGQHDAWGRPLSVTEPALSDEISAATGLVVRKAAKTPLVVLRGLDWIPSEDSSAQDILRAKTEDMFR